MRSAQKGGRSRVTQSRKIVAGCFVPSETTWAHFSTARSAISSRTVNTTLTLRNWAIGFYIREYEQNGSDRAKYGREVLGRVAERLSAAGVEELTARYLRLCRQFASVYSWIWRSMTAQSGAEAIGGAAADQHAIVLVQSLKTATVSP